MKDSCLSVCLVVCSPVRQKTDQLYDYALRYFNDSPLLHVMAADYIRYVHNNVGLEQLHLACAEVGTWFSMPLRVVLKLLLLRAVQCARITCVTMTRARCRP